MDLHSPTIKGKATLDANATYDAKKDLVPREFVELKANGFVVVRDVIPSDSDTGIVGVKDFMANTIPENLALTQCITNTPQIRVLLECEPDRTAFSTDVTVNGQPAVLDSVPGNSRLYTGYCDLVLDAEADEVDLLVESSTGQSYTMKVILAIGAPEIVSVTIEALPITRSVQQTAVKAGDSLSISGVVANDAVKISALAKGAVASITLMTHGDDDSAGEGYKNFTGSVRISDVGSDAPVSIVTENFLETESDPFDSAPVPIDQQYPVIPQATYQYPVGQTALKDGEQVSVTSDIQFGDVFTYAVQTGFTVPNPDTFEATKVISLVTGESYRVDNDYYVISASRNSNGAMSTKKFTLDVANAAPAINIVFVGSPDHLRSSEAGNTYKLRVTSSGQRLDNAPSALLASAGILTGNWVKKNSAVWETEISIRDIDPRGEQTLSGLVVAGSAGVVTNTILGTDTFTIQGFLVRDVVVPALSQKVAIGTAVTDANQVKSFYKGADELSYVADLSFQQAGFSVVNAAGELDASGDHLWISDSDFAGTNTSGTLILTVEEL